MPERQNHVEELAQIRKNRLEKTIFDKLQVLCIEEKKRYDFYYNCHKCKHDDCLSVSIILNPPNKGQGIKEIDKSKWVICYFDFIIRCSNCNWQYTFQGHYNTKTDKADKLALYRVRTKDITDKFHDDL